MRGRKSPSYLEELEAEAKLDTPVKKADTLEELAVLMGLEPQVLIAAVERYNAQCAAGRDEDFGKDPAYLRPLVRGPYYAIYQKMFHENAVGGMVIDAHARVLRQGRPIPGIYAAGDTTKELMVPGDVAFDYIESVITALTQAVSLGYRAGAEAAAYTV